MDNICSLRSIRHLVTIIRMEEFDRVIMVFGMTGSGVSSTVNSILGWNACRVESGMHSTTQEIQSETKIGERIQVIDMPDLVSIDRNYKSDWKSREVLSRLTLVTPDAVFLAIRCDERYTSGQYEIYKKMREKLGDLITPDNLIIVFTHGNFFKEELIQHASGELLRVLQDAKHQHAVLENSATDGDKDIVVCRLLTMVDKLRNPSAPERTPAEMRPSRLPWDYFTFKEKTVCFCGVAFIVCIIVSIIILVKERDKI